MSSFDAFSVNFDHQHPTDDNNFSGYSRFSGSDVPVVDHTSAASSSIFRFNNPDPSLPSNRLHEADNGNEKVTAFSSSTNRCFRRPGYFDSQAIVLRVVKVVEGRRESEGKGGVGLRWKKIKKRSNC